MTLDHRRPDGRRTGPPDADRPHLSVEPDSSRLFVAVLIVVATRPIIRRVAILEGHAWLVRVMTISLILHLVAAPAQIFVVDHFYHGIADWLRYDNQGAGLAGSFRHFDFSLANGNLRGIVNDGSVSIAAGIVFTFVGTNPLAGFLVFSWLAFLGTMFFFRAFALTFAGADHRRYAYLLFFLPSMIFWTADVSKEAIMMLSLGVLAYGAPRSWRGDAVDSPWSSWGWPSASSSDPNELLMVAAGFTVAMILASAGTRRPGAGGHRVLTIAFFGTLLAVSVYLTLHYLHGSGGSLSLDQVQQNNASNGGSGGIPYSTNLLTYWRDVYVILLDPLPINFHGLGEMIAALENTIILGLIVASWRQLQIVPRASFARAYVMMCAIYSFGFIYAFAALGNLGLITRERTLLFPFLLVLLCIPRAKRGQPPRYIWELKRKQRKRYEQAGIVAVLPSALPPPRGVTVRPSTAGGRQRSAASPARPSP